MASANDIIASAARKIGVLGQDETPSSAFSANALSVLNAMLDSWQLERLMVFQIVQGSYTWTASTTSMTIGSGGDFTDQRPVRIESAFTVDSSSQWTPLTVMRSREQYDAITLKTSTSTIPQYLFMDPANPLGVLYLYPVPSSSLTLKLNTWQTLQAFTSLTGALALPPGYQRAIEFNLAVEMHADYPTIPLSQGVVKIATESKANIKALNAPDMVSRVDCVVANLGSRGMPNILTNAYN